MINKNELNPKKYYSDWFIEDSKDAYFVINHNGISNNVRIGIILEKLQNQNESEKLLFLLEEELKKLQEDLYIKILEEQKNVVKEDINPKRKKRH